MRQFVRLTNIQADSEKAPNLVMKWGRSCRPSGCGATFLVISHVHLSVVSHKTSCENALIGPDADLFHAKQVLDKLNKLRWKQEAAAIYEGLLSVAGVAALWLNSLALL